MKTAKDILLENIPKDCWWEEMENLTNTPVEYVTKAMESFAAQSVTEYKEKLVDELLKEHGHRNNSVLFIDTVEKFRVGPPVPRCSFTACHWPKCDCNKF